MKSKKVYLLILALMTLVVSCSAGEHTDSAGGDPGYQLGDKTGFTKYNYYVAESISNEDGYGEVTTDNSVYINKAKDEYKIEKAVRLTGKHQIGANEDPYEPIYANFINNEDGELEAQEGTMVDNPTGITVTHTSSLGDVTVMSLSDLKKAGYTLYKFTPTKYRVWNNRKRPGYTSTWVDFYEEEVFFLIKDLDAAQVIIIELYSKPVNIWDYADDLSNPGKDTIYTKK